MLLVDETSDGRQTLYSVNIHTYKWPLAAVHYCLVIQPYNMNVSLIVHSLHVVNVEHADA